MCCCPGDCEGGPECLDDEGGPLPQPSAREWRPSDQPPDPPPGSGPVEVEKWTWTLATNAHESAVELWRDDDHRITIPLTPDQVELLLGHPHTLASALEGFPGL